MAMPANPPGPLSAGSPPLPDIRGIVPAQPFFLPANYWWLLAGLTALLLAAWVFWRFFLRERLNRPARGPTPGEVAARRLRELEERVDALDPRAFGGEVCDVLRAYIGAQFGLHPERQTSPEFLESISRSSEFAPAQKALLAEFLDQCDLLKFARLDATRDGKRRLLRQAGEFLQATAAPALPEAARV